jgi:hypothetical protein
MLILFQYEKLPKFCFRCGVIKHGVTGCSERSNARKQNANTEYGPWIRAPSPKRVFGGWTGHMPERREPNQRGFGGGYGRRDHDRRNSPNRWEHRSRSPELGGGRFFGVAENEEVTANHVAGTSMERNNDQSKFPPKRFSSVSAGGVKRGENEAENQKGVDGVMGGDMAPENQQGAFNADSKMPRSDLSKSGVMGEDMAPENQQGVFNAYPKMPRSAHSTTSVIGGENQGVNCGIDEESLNNMGGSASFNAILDELAKNSQGDSKTHGKGLDRNFSQGMEKAKSDGKWSTGLGNFFTMDEVEKKIKTALSDEKRRASAELWKKTDRTGNSKTQVVENGVSQGKRKMREFSGVRDDLVKKGRIRGGRNSMTNIGVVIKNDKHGSGMAAAGEQPRRPQ